MLKALMVLFDDVVVHCCCQVNWVQKKGEKELGQRWSGQAVMGWVGIILKGMSIGQLDYNYGEIEFNYD